MGSTAPGQKRLSIALGVVVDRWGRILMIRRRKEEVGKDSAKLIWAFPGGKVNKGESKSGCAAREILVETGYAIRPIRLVSVRRHPEFNVLVSYYFAVLARDKPAGQPIEPDEVAEIRWVPASKVYEFVTSNLDPKVRGFLARISKSTRRGSLRQFFLRIARSA